MQKLLTQLALACTSLSYACIGFGNVNPITLTYLNNGTTDFSIGANGSAYYKVTLNAGVMPPNAALYLSLTSANTSSPALVAQQLTSGSPASCNGLSLCSENFSLIAGQSCCLALTLMSSTAGDYSLQPLVQTSPPAFSGQAPSALPVAVGTASLSVIPSTLALSVTGLTTTTGNNSGTPRVFTIQNSASETAIGVTCPTTTSPSIASITCAGCGTILSGSTCTVTITPSSTASAAPGDTSPTAVTLTIQGSNTNTLNPAVNVLTYGSYYQAGYLFSIIETANTSASIGGTVAAETDAAAQSPGVGYSRNGLATTTNMFSGTLGAANTEAMEIQYGTSQTYSAAYCIAPNYSAGGYTDWYLPAECEMGYGGSDSNFDCSTLTSPDYIPNIQANLLEANPSQTFNFATSGIYWSSTASANSYYEPYYAWFQLFAFGGGNGVQNLNPVNFTYGVRCVRALT